MVPIFYAPFFILTYHAELMVFSVNIGATSGYDYTTSYTEEWGKLDVKLMGIGSMKGQCRLSNYGRMLTRTVRQ